MRKLTTKWYITFVFRLTINCQKSRWKVKIYVDEQQTFLKEAWHFNKRVKKKNCMVREVSE